MAKILSSAIAGLAERFNGQVLLDLPDELPTELLGEIVSVANSRVAADPLFAWLLVDRREDLGLLSPTCGFRELAQLREDRRLVVCYASDNRGMSTFTTVYAPLFGPEFPSLPNSETITGGIASLDDLATEIAARIEESTDSKLFGDELVEGTGSVLALLADSYRKEGNTRSSWVSRWWLHVARWADAFVEAANTAPQERAGVDLLSLLFGVAGLPSPDSGPSYRPAMRREYAATIQDRWSSIGSIQDELARLMQRPDSTDGAKRLERIAWESELVGSMDGAGSLIEAIAFAGARTK